MTAEINQKEKPCRACMDFRAWMKLNSKSGNAGSSKVNNPDKENSNAIQHFNIPIEDEYGGRGTSKKKPQQTSQAAPVDPDDDYYPKWGLAAKYGCPADSQNLGRGSWRLLHSMAAYYPETPSSQVKEDMKSFLDLFSKFYPCTPCAEDFRVWMKENPPDVNTKSSLSKWFCVAHNEVNRKLGKEEFDCNLIDQRWFDGWRDGSCD